MQNIREDRVRSRYASGLVRAMDMMCPNCHTLATFESGPWQEHGRQVTATESACGNCEDTVLLVQLLNGNGGCVEGGLYVHPDSSARVPLPGAARLETVSAPLHRTYESALKLYNQGDWGPAALVVRHFLDGLCRQLLGDARQDPALPAGLDALPDHLDLADPLRGLGRLFAPDGAFGRHFDDEGRIDRALATQMLDLLERIVEYAVVMPATLAELKTHIASAPVSIRRERDSSAA